MFYLFYFVIIIIFYAVFADQYTWLRLNLAACRDGTKKRDLRHAGANLRDHDGLPVTWSSVGEGQAQTRRRIDLWPRCDLKLWEKNGGRRCWSTSIFFSLFFRCVDQHFFTFHFIAGSGVGCDDPTVFGSLRPFFRFSIDSHRIGRWLRENK